MELQVNQVESICKVDNIFLKKKNSVNFLRKGTYSENF